MRLVPIKPMSLIAAYTRLVWMMPTGVMAAWPARARAMTAADRATGRGTGMR